MFPFLFIYSFGGVINFETQIQLTLDSNSADKDLMKLV